MKTAEEIQLAKEKRRMYMREYKRKQYADNKFQTNMKQKLYYHQKHNPNVNLNDLKQITVMRAEFIKVLCNLQKIKEHHPDMLKEYLIKYIQDL